MPKKPKYRLQVLLVIKERVKRDKEILLARALAHLKAQEEKLKELEKEREEIESRIKRERLVMYEEVASGTALMRDPQVRMNFLRKLKEDLEEMERRIEEQKETIRQAKIAVQRSRQDYILAAQELNVMEKHKELWLKKEAKALTAAEDKQMNELGQVVHQMAARGRK